ncbi:MAG: cytochrome d ubiquinol oxidase subunit II [Cyclobacteriaceae bacterium]|nr:cytochrome d ubiquinol oxidase subunit II [Cyclobacteriaceae bacterium]
MIYVVIVFLYLSILLYLILGGADFGAGIIELFSSSKHKNKTRLLTYQAIGPVWEANHMWLIIAIVILFVGFPEIYSTLSTFLHIPLLIMLFGIVARGTAFIFRHYDAVKDQMQSVYNFIFVYSSFITPLFLGIIAASVISGSIDTSADTFISAYIFSWLGWFQVSVGLFTVLICGFLATVFLVGETKDGYIQKIFTRKAMILNMLTVLSGGIVFLVAEIQGLPLIRQMLSSYFALTCLLLASISLYFMWKFLKTAKKNMVRLLAGFQVSMILLAVFQIHLPDFVIFSDGQTLSLFNHAAHASTIQALAWALMLGSVFILPALFYLMWSFQRSPHIPHAE